MIGFVLTDIPWKKYNFAKVVPEGKGFLKYLGFQSMMCDLKFLAKNTKTLKHP